MSEKCPCCLQTLNEPIPLYRGDIWWDWDDGETGCSGPQDILDEVAGIAKVDRAVSLPAIWVAQLADGEVGYFRTEDEALAALNAEPGQ